MTEADASATERKSSRGRCDGSAMTSLLMLAILNSTPRIDAYVSACAVPVDGFSAL
jgi:hypothetical protein